jgi:hypothetical protein
LRNHPESLGDVSGERIEVIGDRHLSCLSLNELGLPTGVKQELRLSFSIPLRAVKMIVISDNEKPYRSPETQ